MMKDSVDSVKMLSPLHSTTERQSTMDRHAIVQIFPKQPDGSIPYMTSLEGSGLIVTQESVTPDSCPKLYQALEQILNT